MGQYTILPPTSNDKYWQSKNAQVREIRLMEGPARQQATQDALDEGWITPAELKIVWYNWDALVVLGAAAISRLTRSPDLLDWPVLFSPQWPNRRGDATGVGNAWYEVPGDTAPVGAVSADGLYEVFMGGDQPGTSPTYSPNPTAFGIPTWVAVKPAPSASVSVPGVTAGLGPILGSAGEPLQAADITPVVPGSLTALFGGNS